SQVIRPAAIAWQQMDDNRQCLINKVTAAAGQQQSQQQQQQQKLFKCYNANDWNKVRNQQQQQQHKSLARH
ncbi:unnamed protein product, partial [Ceratitis capitata]